MATVPVLGGVDRGMADNPADASSRQLLELARSAAEEAGRLLMDGLASGPTLVRSKTSRTDLVSDLDQASEALILDHLRRKRPHDAFLAEEGGGRPGSSGVRWIIDPLDGTVNFLYGLPAFCVSVAAEVGGTVTAGVVHDPGRSETFSAVVGGGAWLGGRRLAVNRPGELALALVGTGFAYRAEVRAEQGGVVAGLLPRVRDIRRFGSAALDLCYVAAGRLDAYFERGTQPWDRAAGALVASEAGAVVTDLAGGPPSEEMVVAAAPDLASELRAVLTGLGA